SKMTRRIPIPWARAARSSANRWSAIASKSIVFDPNRAFRSNWTAYPKRLNDEVGSCETLPSSVRTGTKKSAAVPLLCPLCGRIRPPFGPAAFAVNETQLGVRLGQLPVGIAHDIPHCAVDIRAAQRKSDHAVRAIVLPGVRK